MAQTRKNRETPCLAGISDKYLVLIVAFFASALKLLVLFNILIATAGFTNIFVICVHQASGLEARLSHNKRISNERQASIVIIITPTNVGVIELLRKSKSIEYSTNETLLPHREN